MDVLASSIAVEKSVGLAAHYRRRKLPQQIRTCVFPQNFSWDRQKRKSGVPPGADGVRKVITGLLNCFQNRPVKAPVGIGKVLDGSSQAVLQRLPGFNDLPANFVLRLTSE